MNLPGSSNYSFLEKTEDDESTNGFDLQAGLSWAYPTNYPLREYQYNIIQEALFKNTLVSLPTGLGKTFIASVVMYNFYRWYPTGKVIFLAPTKPLVKQQIDACYDITAIPPEATAELTGTKAHQIRNDIWLEKRVFFATPQVLQNDLNYVEDLGISIKCIVFDEAHRAKGNHAYCEVVRRLLNINKYFRVLALSATPGSSVDDVSEVIKNLRISHLEFRNEDSEDVKPYVFKRTVESVVVPLGEKLQEVRDDYIEILDKYVRILIRYKIVSGNCNSLTKGRIFMAMKEFKQRNSGNANYNEIIKNLNICMTLYHAFELLVRHGLRSFLTFFEEHIDKPLLRGNTQLINIVNNLRSYLGPLPEVEKLPDGTYPEISQTIKFGHPKFYKLRNILIEHFSSCSEDQSRTIVFFEYRESVKEAFIVLLQARPLIKARIFLGQGYGITQKVQLNVVKAFREGECNTLLATCIGEEGLDVGEVGLIVCFDISSRSPIRMVQRMGRTGRKREGKVVVLITEGKEQQTFQECMNKKDHLTHFVLNSSRLKNEFVESPRLVPKNINPQCIKTHFTVKKIINNKKNTIKDMLKNISSKSSCELSQDIEVVDINEKIKPSTFLWNQNLENFDDFKDINFMCSKYLTDERSIQAEGLIKESDQSKLFVDLLKSVEAKRFNIPLTQEINATKNLRQGDIRSMFLKTASKSIPDPSQDAFFPMTQICTQNSNQTNEALKQDDKFKELHLEISSYLTINLSIEKKCKICKLFKCNLFNLPEKNDTQKISIPSDTVYKELDLKDLDYFLENVALNKKNDNYEKLEEVDIKEESVVSFKAPKSLVNLISRFNISENILSPEQINNKNIKDNISENVLSPEQINEKKFKEDLQFTSIEKDEHHLKELKINNDHTSKQNNLSNLLEFFKLKSLEELFDVKNKPLDSKKTTLVQNYSERSQTSVSPNLFDYSEAEDMETSLSPILGERIEKIKDIQIKLNTTNNLNTSHILPEKNITSFNSKSDSDEDLLSNMFECTYKNKKTKENISKSHVSNLNLNDLCDLTNFGLDNEHDLVNNNKKDSIIAPRSPKKVCDKNINPLENCDIRNISLSYSNKVECRSPERDETITIENSPEYDIITIEDSPERDNIRDSPEIMRNTSPILSQKKNIQRRICTQLSTTQILSLVSKENAESLLKTQLNDSNQIDDTHGKNKDHQEEFNFSFNNKKRLESSEINNKLINKSSRNNNQNKSCNMSVNLFFDDNLDDFNFSFNNKTPCKDLNSSNKKTKQNNNFNKTLKEDKSKLSESISCPKNNENSLLNDLGNFEEFNFSFNKNRENSHINNSSFINADSDDDFEKSKITSLKLKCHDVSNLLLSPAKKRKKKRVNEFLDDEAEVSDDASDDESSGSEDRLDASFVNDLTQADCNDTAMHAKYLQSIKSPKKSGMFKIPHINKPISANIFSQPIQDDTENTYLNDSFCVNTEQIDSDDHELSQLEILEMKLKKRKKKDQIKPKKRRRIICIDDSDESN